MAAIRHADYLVITIVAHMQCVAGTEPSILEASRWFVSATRSEPGCIDFYLHQQLDDPTRFVWYENFADQTAVDAHVASEHVKRWFALLARVRAQNAYSLYSRVNI